MATPDEIADTLAGFSLFAELSNAELQQVAHTFDEAVYPEGERIIRQGLSGSAFYIILDGDAAIIVDGEQRATLGRGDPERALKRRQRHADTRQKVGAHARI